MSDSGPTIYLGRGTASAALHLRYANRHGLVAGATGTGKTVTLQILAEGFSRAGVPVFCADVKGDLSGISQPGTMNPKLEARARGLGVLDYAYEASPVIFWDLFREQGHPIRTTVSEMGPLLLARLLDLNETQEGVLHIAFRLADEQGLLLLDFQDLVAMLHFVAEHGRELTTVYGHVSRSSIGAIQRRLLILEQQGGTFIFGEPALALQDLMLTTADGRGVVNVLMADRLIARPRVYTTFLLWLLAELFEELPELGDQEKPRLVFFFDEAHLLFRDAPRALLEKVEQVVRLIRSKGVGVFFVTQNPLDIPGRVLAQLGNRIQHALRAYTPAEQRAVRAAAEAFRRNPAFDTAEVITQLAVGEALVSTLGPGGVPSVVERVKIVPPRSRLGSISPEERARILEISPLAGRYDRSIDRDSAFEVLTGQARLPLAAAKPEAPATRDGAPVRGAADPWGGVRAPAPSDQRGGPEEIRRLRHIDRPRAGARPQQPQGGFGSVLSDILAGRGGRREGLGEALLASVGRSIGRQIGRAVLRGLLGSILKR